MRDFFSDLIRKVERQGTSTSITLYTLILNERDSVTGWYVRSYEPSTINAVLIDVSSAYLLTGLGSYVRTDASLFCSDDIEDGDIVLDAFNTYYKVKGRRRAAVGSNHIVWQYDLSYSYLNPTVLEPTPEPQVEGWWGYAFIVEGESGYQADLDSSLGYMRQETEITTDS